MALADRQLPPIARASVPLCTTVYYRVLPGSYVRYRDREGLMYSTEPGSGQ